MLHTTPASFLFNLELSGDNYKWTALAVASLGTLIGILNASTLIIALPSMIVKLNTTVLGVHCLGHAGKRGLG